MSNREIVVLTNISMITAVVQRGIADVIVRAAIEAGAQGATIYYGRGSGVRERLGVLGLAVEAEKEIVKILIANDEVDRVFEQIYEAGAGNFSQLIDILTQASQSDNPYTFLSDWLAGR